jgi:hypothetical protein
MRRQALVPAGTLIVAVAGLGLLLSGCGEAGPGEGEITKEQARAAGGGKADGVDYCQIYDWYNDGICGDFCARPDPDCTPSCLPQACPLHLPVCENGYKVDDSGCPTCECLPPPRQCDLGNQVTCALYCPYGFKTDENGCSTCSCSDVPLPPIDECSPVLCELYCENGFDTDENGCEVCRCKAEPDPGVCGEVLCAIYCEFGNKVDENGCEICACNEPPTGGDRNVAEGQCIRNSDDECTTDADCVAGGCGGELCHNPAAGGGFSTCDCTSPSGVSCGCVNGRCNWYN